MFLAALWDLVKRKSGNRAGEEWVSGNISDSPVNEIAATLWLLGVEDGEMAIISAIKSSASKKSPATE